MASEMREAKCFCGETKIDFKNDPMMHFMCHCTNCKVIFIHPNTLSILSWMLRSQESTKRILTKVEAVAYCM